MVAPGTAVAEAEQVMRRYETDWVAVGEGGRLDGWWYAHELNHGSTVERVGARPFRTRLDVSATLKEALDAVVSSHTRIAAVFDGERYLGMLTADRISEEIVQ